VVCANSRQSRDPSLLRLIFNTAETRDERSRFVFGEMILRECISMVELQAQNYVKLNS
jgi:hypothetical protein